MADTGKYKFLNNFSCKFLLFTVFLVLVCCFCVNIKAWVRAATPPALITYQGKVLVGGTAATTSLSMKFVLYDSASGGVPLYTLAGTTSTPSAVSITPSSGLFTVDLGGAGYNSLDAEIFKNYGSVYLEITIGAEILAPRKQIGAAPYAFNAKYLDGVSTATSSNSVYIPLSDADGNFIFNNITSTRLSVTSNTYFTGDINSFSGLTVNNNGIILVSSTPVTTNNALYALGSTLYWNNSALGSGLTGGVLNALSYWAGTDTMSSTDIYWDSGSLISGLIPNIEATTTERAAFAFNTQNHLSADQDYVLSVKNYDSPLLTVNHSGNLYIAGTTTVRNGIFQSQVDWVGSTSTNLFSDPSFENFDASIRYWSTSVVGTATATKSGVTAFDGNYSLYAYSGSDYVLINKTVSTTANTPYNLSFYAKGVNSNEQVGVFFTFLNHSCSSSPDYVYYYNFVSDTWNCGYYGGGIPDNFFASTSEYIWRNTVSNTAFIRFNKTFTSVSTSTDLFVGFVVGSDDDSGDDQYVYIDAAQIESGNSPTAFKANAFDVDAPLFQFKGYRSYADWSAEDNLFSLSDSAATEFFSIRGNARMMLGNSSATGSIMLLRPTPAIGGVTTTIDNGGITFGGDLNGAASFLGANNFYIRPTTGSVYLQGPTIISSYNGNNEVSFAVGNKLSNTVVSLTNTSSTTDRVLSIQGVSGQTGYLTSWLNSSSSVLGYFNATGDIFATGTLSLGNGIDIIGGTLTFSDVDATNTLSFASKVLFEVDTDIDYDGFIFNMIDRLESPDLYLLSLRLDGVPKFSVASNGDVHTVGTLSAATATVGIPGTPGDLAERVDIAIDDVVEAGDVMMVDQSSPDTYRRTGGAYAQAVAGVISTNPTIVVGNGRTEYTGVLAMVGRVPVKVSGENGLIRRGDLLVSASLPGYAMKYSADQDGEDKIIGVIGVALENMETTTTGKIMALIRTGWVNDRFATIGDLQKNIQYLASVQGIDLEKNTTALGVEDQEGVIAVCAHDWNLSGFSILNVRTISSPDNKWMIDADGRFITRLNTSNGAKEMYALQSPAVEFVFSGSAQLAAGTATIVFDQMTQEIIDPTTALKVNVTLTSGNASGIYVSDKGQSGFTVKELNNGTSDATFDWMVVAKKGELAATITSSVPSFIENTVGQSVETTTLVVTTTVNETTTIISAIPLESSELEISPLPTEIIINDSDSIYNADNSINTVTNEPISVPLNDNFTTEGMDAPNVPEAPAF